jgi:hypothetical protein
MSKSERVARESRFRPFASSRVASQLEIREPQVMGATIDTFDDRKGGALQFIVEAARSEPSEDGLIQLITVHGEPGDVSTIWSLIRVRSCSASWAVIPA